MFSILQNQPIWNTGVRISSSSYGSVYNSRSFPLAYDQTSRELDEFAYDHPDYVRVWAAGNAGLDQGKDGRGVDSFVEAKNCITGFFFFLFFLFFLLLLSSKT